MSLRLSRQGLVVVVAVGGLIAVGAALGGGSGAAGARRPTDDNRVLARVPATALDPRAREVRALERRLAETPGELDIALELARLRVEEARRQGDPRPLGYAESALAPWWYETLPPVP